MFSWSFYKSLSGTPELDVNDRKFDIALRANDVDFTIKALNKSCKKLPDYVNIKLIKYYVTKNEICLPKQILMFGPQFCLIYCQKQNLLNFKVIKKILIELIKYSHFVKKILDYNICIMLNQTTLAL